MLNRLCSRTLLRVSLHNRQQAKREEEIDCYNAVLLGEGFRTGMEKSYGYLECFEMIAIILNTHILEREATMQNVSK